MATRRGTAGTWVLCWIVALCGLLPRQVQAQGSAGGADPLRVILSPGVLLAGGTVLESGAGGLAQLAVERSRHRVLLRLAVIADVAGFPDGSGDGSVSEVGLLYGRRGTGGGPGWSVSAGLAAVHFQRCPGEPEDAFYDPGCSTVGLPLVAETGLGNRVVGIAVQLFGNLNPHAPFAGVGVTLPLGWMR